MKLSKTILFMGALIALSSCSNAKINNSFEINKQPATKVFAYQSATSLGLISQFINTSSQLNEIILNENDSSFINEITRYLGSIEMALESATFLPNIKVENSDNDEYQTMINISFTDINSDYKEFIIYFNSTIKEVEKDEEEYILDGILINEDVTYHIYGEKEIEKNEEEYKFIFQYDENLFVEIEQENEYNSQEFSYSLIQNGHEIYQYEMKLNNNSVEMEIEDQESNIEVEFKFITKDNENYIKAEYEKNNEKVEVLFRKIYDLETGQYSYEIVK